MTTPLSDIYAGRRILVTGHTGFKGAWLCEWLLALGADLTGFSLAQPPTEPSLHAALDLDRRMRSVRGDLRDLPAVQRVIEAGGFDFVFHLGAQALVRQSYKDPVGTYGTNVMGTVNVLEALRMQGRRCVAVVVSSDKCYENREREAGYEEHEPMGGHDPYSSSKGCTELVVSAFRRSYFQRPRDGVRLASARAGNAIGGGDWAMDRIVPDCVRHLKEGRPVAVRNPFAVRPWQHVLEPLSGYLTLAARLDQAKGDAQLAELCSGYNFGPQSNSLRTVRDLVDGFLQTWPGTWRDHSDPQALHEAGLLGLAVGKAERVLGWRSTWDFATTVRRTAAWYKEACATPGNVREITKADIAAYVEAAREAGIPWAAEKPAGKAPEKEPGDTTQVATAKQRSRGTGRASAKAKGPR